MAKSSVKSFQRSIIYNVENLHFKSVVIQCSDILKVSIEMQYSGDEWCIGGDHSYSAPERTPRKPGKDTATSCLRVLWWRTVQAHFQLSVSFELTVTM